MHSITLSILTGAQPCVSSKFLRVVIKGKRATEWFAILGLHVVYKILSYVISAKN